MAELSCDALKAALETVSRDTRCTPVGDELALLSFPFHYADGDHPQVLVHFDSSPPRLEDFGNGVGRLRGLGLELEDGSATSDALFEMVAASGLEIHNDAISMRVDWEEGLANQLVRLVTCLLQVDALRYGVRAETQNFADRVLEWIDTNRIVPIVEPRRKVSVDGREYQVTARLSRSIREYESGEYTFLQAIADRGSLMRAHFVFGDLPNPSWRKVVVIQPERVEALAPLLPRLAEVATVGAWSEARKLARWLRSDDETRREAGTELLSQQGLI